MNILNKFNPYWSSAIHAIGIGNNRSSQKHPEKRRLNAPDFFSSRENFHHTKKPYKQRSDQRCTKKKHGKKIKKWNAVACVHSFKVAWQIQSNKKEKMLILILLWCYAYLLCICRICVCVFVHSVLRVFLFIFLFLFLTSSRFEPCIDEPLDGVMRTAMHVVIWGQSV